jgi:hypothetical protein
VRISFPEPRQALLTASWGRLGGGADSTCPNRVVTATAAGATPTLTFPWQVACRATGSAQLRVTSAKGSSAPFRQASTELPVGAPTAPECAAAAAEACGGAPAAAAGAAAPLAAAPLAPRPPPGTTSSAGGGCRPSPLGYQCMTDLDTETGVRLHFSQGTAAPPVNPCTQNAPARGPSAALAAANPRDMLHFAAEAPTDGSIALSFPESPGSMAPADAVIGWVEANADGQGADVPDAQAYVLDTGYKVGKGNALAAETQSWATRVGAARLDGGTTVACFSRPRRSSLARYSPEVDPAAAKLNWAVSRRPGLTMHARAGGMTMNLLRGAATGASALTSGGGGGGGAAGGGAPARLFGGGAGDSLGGLSPALAAHGMLGMIAFALLMPLGMVLSRHKWLFGPSKSEAASAAAASGGGGGGGGGAGATQPRSGRVGRGWFLAHAAVQSLAVLTAVVALLTVLLGVGWDRTPPSAAYDAHRAMGIIAVSVAVLQAALGAAFRPRDVSGAAAASSLALAAGGKAGGGPGAPAAAAAANGGASSLSLSLSSSSASDAHQLKRRRTAWLHGHRTGGWLALLCGWTAVFLGCGQMVAVRGADPAWWFGPAAALALAFVLLGLTLEAFKRQMQLTGRYDPRSREVRRDLALLSPVSGVSRAGTGGGGGGGGAGGRGASAGGAAAVAGGAGVVGAAALANGHRASAGGASSGFQSAGGASAAPSAAGTAYYSAAGGSSIGGSSGGGAALGAGGAGAVAPAPAAAAPAAAGGDVYPDIVAGVEDGRSFLPPPPAV